jgi:alkylated DNA nucleotide flippase Atl1
MTRANDSIVVIEPERETFFGGPGRMLKPSLQTVAALVSSIPAGKLMTTISLREVLSRDFHVQGTCPTTTRSALIALSEDMLSDQPYWRVVNASGGLLAFFPGGRPAQAKKLEAEGVRIEARSKTIGVANLAGHLYDPDNARKL